MYLEGNHLDPFPIWRAALPYHRRNTVKCIVHWFQMMQSGKLSMFGDCAAGHFVPVTYDVSKVSCPVGIVYGGSDHLGMGRNKSIFLRGRGDGEGGGGAAAHNAYLCMKHLGCEELWLY